MKRSAVLFVCFSTTEKMNSYILNCIIAWIMLESHLTSAGLIEQRFQEADKRGVFKYIVCEPCKDEDVRDDIEELVDCFNDIDESLDLRQAKKEFPHDVSKCTDKTKMIMMRAMAKRSWSSTGVYATCVPLMPDSDLSEC